MAAAQDRSTSTFGYTQAKALIFPETNRVPADTLRLHSYSISPAQGSQVTIKFLASPINPSDVNQIQGFYANSADFNDSLGTGNEKVAVPGNEGVAEVVAVGDKVKSLKVGDWVIMGKTSFGTWRTHASTTEDKLQPIPKEWRGDLSPVAVGSIAVNPSTAYRLLTDFWPAEIVAKARYSPGTTGVKIAPKERVGHGEWFIQNAANSMVGRSTIQLAKEWGIHSINLIRSRPDKAETDALKKELKGLGADIVLTDEELEDKEGTKKLLESHKAVPRVAFNTVGGKAVIPMLNVIADGTTVVTYGAMAKAPVPVAAGPLIFRDIRFVGFWLSRWTREYPERRPDMLQDIFQHLRSSHADPKKPALVLTSGLTDKSLNLVEWDQDTPFETLIKPINATLEGFKSGKGVFVFGKK